MTQTIGPYLIATIDTRMLLDRCFWVSALQCPHHRAAHFRRLTYCQSLRRLTRSRATSTSVASVQGAVD